MTAHTHTERVDGCFRCELSRDEAEATAIEVVVTVPAEAFDRHPDWRDDERIDVIYAVADELFRGHDVDIEASRCQLGPR